MKLQISKNILLAWVGIPFFTLYALNLDQFGSSAFEIPPFLVWVISFLAFMPILLAAADYRQMQRMPMFYWLLLYNVMCVIGLSYSPTSAVRYDSFVMLLSTNIVLLPALLLASRQWVVPHWVAFSILLLAVASVILDYSQPFVTSGLNSRGFIDRASGIYINPNTAGAFIPLALALVLRESRSYMRIPLIALAAAGVLLTFSRAGPLQFLYILVFLAYSKILPRYYLVFMPLCIFVIALAGSLSDTIKAMLDVQSKNATDRLDLFLGQGNFSSFKDDDRAVLVWEALKKISEAPLAGHGFGFNNYWGDLNSIGAATHNMFLRFMLDFGLVGAIIWLLLIASFYFHLRKNNPISISYFLTGYLFLVSIFSHNLSEQGWFLVMIVFLSVIKWNPDNKSKAVGV